LWIIRLLEPFEDPHIPELYGLDKREVLPEGEVFVMGRRYFLMRSSM
jgi:hypothetical protein